MSRGTFLQNTIGGSRQRGIPAEECVNEKRCPCGLHCKEGCYRREFDELVQFIDSDDGALEDSPRTITVSTSRRRIVQVADLNPIAPGLIRALPTPHIENGISECSRSTRNCEQAEENRVEADRTRSIAGREAGFESGEANHAEKSRQESSSDPHCL